MKIVFSVTMLCGLADTYKRFGVTSFLHLQGRRLKRMEKKASEIKRGTSSGAKSEPMGAVQTQWEAVTLRRTGVRPVYRKKVEDIMSAYRR
jgi:hypothetical protein